MDSEENSIDIDSDEEVSDEEVSDEEVSDEEVSDEKRFHGNVCKHVVENNYEKLKDLLQTSNTFSLDFYYYGSTPLTLAAEYGHYRICDLLLKRDPNLVNKVNIALSCLSLFSNYLLDVLSSLKTG